MKISEWKEVATHKTHNNWWWNRNKKKLFEFENWMIRWITQGKKHSFHPLCNNSAVSILNVLFCERNRTTNWIIEDNVWSYERQLIFNLFSSLRFFCLLVFVVVEYGIPSRFHFHINKQHSTHIWNKPFDVIILNLEFSFPSRFIFDIIFECMHTQTSIAHHTLQSVVMKCISVHTFWISRARGLMQTNWKINSSNIVCYKR